MTTTEKKMRSNSINIISIFLTMANFAAVNSVEGIPVAKAEEMTYSTPRYLRQQRELPVVTSNNSTGCCSLDFKTCADWCSGTTKDSCRSCEGNNTHLVFLDQGALDVTNTCVARWNECTNTNNACCNGLVCYQRSQWYSQCLHPVDVPK